MTVSQCPQAGHTLFRKQQVVGRYLRSLQQIQLTRGWWGMAEEEQRLLLQKNDVTQQRQRTNLQRGRFVKASFRLFHCCAFPEKGLHHAGEHLRFRRLARIWKWQVLSYYQLVVCYLNATHDLHWFWLLAATQERFTCHIGTGGLTVDSILIYG